MGKSLWQPTAAAHMSAFLQAHCQATSITPVGSVTAPDTLDIFSDVDLKIALPSPTPLPLPSLLAALEKQFGPILGFETHLSTTTDTLRLCFVNGHRYDLSFIYPQPKDPHPVQINPASTLHIFWFLSAMALVKLGRKDHLIAAHLALEIYQLAIVMDMEKRDQALGTQIHRHGQEEPVPILDILSYPSPKNPLTTQQQIIAMVINIATFVDNAPDKIQCLRSLTGHILYTNLN